MAMMRVQGTASVAETKELGTREFITLRKSLRGQDKGGAAGVYAAHTQQKATTITDSAALAAEEPLDFAALGCLLERILEQTLAELGYWSGF